MGGGTQRHGARTGGRAFSDTFAAPLVLGGLFTLAFYGGIAAAPPDWTFLRRYFCSHPLEYVTAGLFFVAIGTLLLKFVQLSTERRQFRSQLAMQIAAGEKLGDPTAALDGLERHDSRTWLMRRLSDVTVFVRSRNTASALEDHLRYLGELAGDQLHRSYAFVRTITWAVPILGFLGTVIGITMAIANVTPEQLDSSLGEVTGGLAVAFDTTALALALSIVLVFGSFVIERAEQQLLADVEDFSVRHFPGLFGSTSSDPLMAAQIDAADTLTESVAGLVARQTQLWNTQLEELRERWRIVADEQSRTLTRSINDGMAETLDDHSQSLRTARDAFAQQFATAIQSLTDRLDNWQDTLAQSAEATTDQAAALTEHGEALLRLTEQQGELIRLEDQLSRNLQAVRHSETFDQTLNNLTAAVHLLSARTSPSAGRAA